MEMIKNAIARIEAELIHVYAIHRTFVQLYKSGKANRELLLEIDSALFQDLFVVYLNYITVAVSRLLDPPKSTGRPTHSLFYLVDLLRQSGLPDHKRLREELLLCKKAAYNFTDPRNQLVAHLDLSCHLGSPNKKPIPSFITKEFDLFYKTAGKILNEIRGAVGLSPFMYEWGVTGHGYGLKLLGWLRKASE